MIDVDTLQYAWIAREAYRYTENIPGFTLIRWLRPEAKDISALIGYTSKDFVIAFTGTNSIEDWVYNFTVYKKVIPYKSIRPEIKVHAGFIEAYRTIREIILGMISHYRPSSIVCTGHSLGGALASLCALDIQYNFGHYDFLSDNIKCVTFAAPRVGNREFSISYNNRIIDSTNIFIWTDLIPRVPFILDWGILGEQIKLKPIIPVVGPFTWLGTHSISHIIESIIVELKRNL